MMDPIFSLTPSPFRAIEGMRWILRGRCSVARRDNAAEYWQSHKAERVQRVRQRKSARTPAVPIDLERTRVDLDASNEATRARAARELCPCHTDWNVFEQNLDALGRMTKDPSPLVRANALHVFEDAFELVSEGLPTTPQALTNEMVARRRQMRWRSDEGADPAERPDPRRRKQDRR
jgi:hypothetical protein